MRNTLLVTSLFLIVAASGCGKEDTAYSIGVTVSGNKDAFHGRTIEIGNRSVAAGAGLHYVELCTHDRAKFLSTPVPLRVSDGTGQLFIGRLERIACRLAKESGTYESDFIVLQDDGTLLVDLTAGTPDVWATCETGFSSACTGEDF